MAELPDDRDQIPRLDAEDRDPLLRVGIGPRLAACIAWVALAVLLILLATYS